jgi:hypothetical protein
VLLEAFIVLFVSVSAVARATRVSVAPEGSVNVPPPFTIAPITGLVRVLFVRVSDVARPTIVSAVFGKVRVTGDAGAGRLSVVVFVVPVTI